MHGCWSQSYREALLDTGKQVIDSPWDPYVDCSYLTLQAYTGRERTISKVSFKKITWHSLDLLSQGGIWIVNKFPLPHPKSTQKGMSETGRKHTFAWAWWPWTNLFTSLDFSFFLSIQRMGWILDETLSSSVTSVREQRLCLPVPGQFLEQWWCFLNVCHQNEWMIIFHLDSYLSRDFLPLHLGLSLRKEGRKEQSMMKVREERM